MRNQDSIESNGGTDTREPMPPLTTQRQLRTGPSALESGSVRVDRSTSILIIPLTGLPYATPPDCAPGSLTSWARRNPTPALAGDRVFGQYPGFAPDAYREYSEPLIGMTRVLRGGAWTSRSRMAHATYRNFFGPERRDVFAGFWTCALKPPR